MTIVAARGDSVHLTDVQDDVIGGDDGVEMSTNDDIEILTKYNSMLAQEPLVVTRSNMRILN